MTIDISQLGPEHATLNPRVRTLSATLTLPAEDGQQVTARLTVFHDRSERLRRTYKAVLTRQVHQVTQDGQLPVAVHVRGGDLLDLFSEDGMEWDEDRLNALYAKAFEKVSTAVAAHDGRVMNFLEP